MYVALHLPIIESYQENLMEYFDAEAKNLDFSKSEEATKLINTEVENATNSKIKDLIAKSD